MIAQNRDAVIAIQGGGVYALSLLGQAKAIIEAGYVLHAFAGTSGGAILASLLWSGLSPDEIDCAFQEMAESDGSLLDLLRPAVIPSPQDVTFQDFLDLKSCFERLRDQIPSTSEQGGGFLRWPEWFSAISAGKNLFHFWGMAQPHFARRGLFTGERLEAELDRLIRKGFNKVMDKRLSPTVRDTVNSLLPPDDDLVRFKHVEEMMEVSGGAFYLPPLLLIATNLSRRKLEIFSTLNPAHREIPIAKAVRASAGFPVFFCPTECLTKEWYVDGGVVSNFPVWAFSDAFREKVATNDFHGILASRPWMRIGLRVIDDITTPPDLAKPEIFLRSLAGMLTGSARNELEEILAHAAPRSVVVRQPVSATNCPGVLSISEVDGPRIADMVERGYLTAQEELKRTNAPGIYAASADLDQIMVAQLKSIVEECRGVFADCNLKVRANIFIPVQTMMKMCFCYNMDGDPDYMIEFPGLSTGVVGACYQLKSRLICNLDKVSKLREQHPENYRRLFDMNEELQEKIKKDRTWLACVPIFDPLELKTVNFSQRALVKDGVQRIALHDLGIGYTGPLLGVLTVDANLDYQKLNMDPDPDAHFEDWRVRAVSAIMQAKALTIGAQLTT